MLRRMTTAQRILAAIVAYHLFSARTRYRGGWWAMYVFLVVSFVAIYYAVSRALVVWPYRLASAAIRP